MTENELNEFERRSKSALKGWITRRAKQKAKKATEKALKGWDTRRENQAKEKQRAEKASQSAKKGWDTRRENAEKANQSTTKPKKKKTNVWLNVLVSILAFIIGAVGAFMVYCYINKPKNDVFVSGNLEIHFLELGNHFTGDSTYIKAGDVDILIDAGSKYNSAATIANYINNYVTDGKLEYVIATHAHEDHIAGFGDTASNGGGIFSRFEVGTVIDFPKTTKVKPYGANSVIGKYTAALEKEIADGAVHYTALECYNNQNGAQRIYQLTDNISLEILYNYYYDHLTSDENDYSVCVMFHHGEDKHFLFTGDLEHNGEEKMVEHYAASGGLPDCVLYKGGHHGSKTSSTTALLNDISPDIICVCCCAGTSEYTDANENQFPTQEFIDRIAPHTKDVYVTSMVDNYVDHDAWDTQGTVKSMNGNIVVTSTKAGTTVVGSNNSTKLKDTDWFRNNRTIPSAWAT